MEHLKPPLGTSQAGFTNLMPPRFIEQKPLLPRTSRRASNHTLATARFLGSFPADQKKVKLKDAIGRGQGIDFYRVELTARSKLGLDFINRSEIKLTTALLDATGAVVAINNRQQKVAVGAGSEGDLFVRNLAAGTYYLQVKGAKQGQHTYKINLAVDLKKSLAPLPCGCDT